MYPPQALKYLLFGKVQKYFPTPVLADTLVGPEFYVSEFMLFF